MIDGGSYYNIYILIITIYTIVLSNKYSNYPDVRLLDKPLSSKLPSILLTLFLILFIGLRPLHSSFVDMWNYTSSYNLMRDNITEYKYNPNSTNIVFDNLFSYLAVNHYNITNFFLIIAAVYFGGIYGASRKLFPSDTLYAIIIYLGAFSTFSYGTNGIKAGAAAAIFLCAIAYGKNKILSVLLLLISIGIHHSMAMPVIAFIICYFYRNPKFYLYLWIFSLLCALLHISAFQEILGGLADDKGSEYLLTEGNDENIYVKGFRLDFVIYSFFPIAIGYYAIFKEQYQSKFYNWLYCTYILTNAVWMLCMYASFTNRIAYLSWIMLPIVLIYPFFDKLFVVDQYKKLNVIAWAHLGFTLMMEFVYYGIIK